MITDYKQNKCKYNYDKLKSVVYLVSEEHIKEVFCNGDNAYISGLTELPMRLNGFDISFNEETSLDERYLFTKTVTLSMNGYVNKSVFGGRYYVILESVDGTYWMVNVDFPSRVTYTFNLSDKTYQTDFTLTSYSNFPTLRLDANFEAVAPPCLGFNTYGIESLKMIEREHAVIDISSATTVYTYGYAMKDIEFMGNSCSFQSQFDGFKCTETLTFNIPFDAYKSSWQYNLLEFTQNLYAAVIKPKSSENTLFAGFHMGFEPNYSIQTTDSKGGSDIITITLIEVSDNGMTAAINWSDEQVTGTRWLFTRQIGDIAAWECVGRGKAKYLVQREVLENGASTGNYKVLEGYEDEFSMLNVVGTFDEVKLFDNNTCAGEACEMYTDIPLNITFTETGCTTYSFSSDCDWEIKNLNANWLTVTPTSGNGGSSYTIQVCNSASDVESTWFTIETEGGSLTVNVSSNSDSAFIRPSSANIDCLAQTVNFAYSPSCPITITSYDERTTYQLNNGSMTVQVPRNDTASATTYNYTAKDCNNTIQTIHIYQDKTYEAWVNTGGFTCISGNSYQEQARYTGTTSATTDTLTEERRAGALIESGDTRCGITSTKWEYTSAYTICIDGAEWSVEEEYITYNGGSTWATTGNIRPLQMLDSASTFCSSAVTYEWRLTDNWVCGSGGSEDYSTLFLTFESLENGNSIYIGTTLTGAASTISASTDNGNTWATVTPTTGNALIGTLDAGDRVLIKGVNFGEYNSEYFRNFFYSTGRFNVYGNIMSLIYGDSFADKTSIPYDISLYGMFQSANKLVSAKNLILPATTLQSRCYQNMFYNCTSLTEAPALPATTLIGNCYQSMFYGCTNLNYIKCLATDISASYCTYRWVSGVASSGTFVKASGMNDWTSGIDGIPNNWTVQDV